MKQKAVVGMFILGLLVLGVTLGFAEEEVVSTQEKIIFSFEEEFPTWEIPDWAFEKDDLVAENIALSTEFAREGKASMELKVDFPGKKWTAAYVNVEDYFDWTPYKRVSADLFIPEGAPFGLKAKFILTVGDDWKWTEMIRKAQLTPGEWTTVTANLIPGSNDWRGTQVTDEFRADVRKLGVQIISNMSPVYKGSIYVDNVRLE